MFDMYRRVTGHAYRTTRRQTNSWSVKSRTGYLTDWSTRQQQI